MLFSNQMSKIQITGSEEETERMDELFEGDLDRKQSVARVMDKMDPSGIVEDAGPAGEPGEPGDIKPGDLDLKPLDHTETGPNSTEIDDLLSGKAQNSSDLGIKTAGIEKADCEIENKQNVIEKKEQGGDRRSDQPELMSSNSNWLEVKAQNMPPETSNYEKSQKAEQELVSTPVGLGKPSEEPEDPVNPVVDRIKIKGV